MSAVDTEMNFAPCGCQKLQKAQIQQQCRRNQDVRRVLEAIQSAVNQKNEKISTPVVSQDTFPSASRHKPKQKMSRHAREMASFSPHGSSESDSDSNSTGKTHKKREKKRKNERYSLLHSNKTVEEELNEEEEMTNEQIDSIIFLRKPVKAVSSALKVKPSVSASSVKGAKQSVELPVHLRSTPKIIPTEPTQKNSIDESPSNRKSYKERKDKHVHPKIIPIEPIDSIQLPSKTQKEKNLALLESINSSKNAQPLQSRPSNNTQKETNLALIETLNSLKQVMSSRANEEISLVDVTSENSIKEKCLDEERSSLPSNVPKSSCGYSVALSSNSTQSKTVKVEEMCTPSSAISLVKQRQTSAKITSNSFPNSEISVDISEIPMPNSDNSIKPKMRKDYASTRGNGKSKETSSKTSLSSKGMSPTLPKQLTSHSYGVPELTAMPLNMPTPSSEDVDMRLSHQHVPEIHPAFLSNHNQQQVSPNLAFGSWLAPGEAPHPSITQHESAAVSDTVKLADAPSPVSLPDESPPSPAPINSPTNGPSSPMDCSRSPFESPVSPPSPPADSESPQSPPHMKYSAFRSTPISIPTDKLSLRSTPIPIPTDRIGGNSSSMGHKDISYCPNISPATNGTSGQKEGIDDATDMADFLNAGMDSDLDSSYDDDHDDR